MSDLALGERFYADILGGDRVRRHGAAFAKVRSEGARGGRPAIHFPTGPLFELTPARETRVALTVRPEDLLAFRAILEAHGIPVDGPRQSGPDGHASLFFLDPFGQCLEIVAMGYRGEITRGEPDLSDLAWSFGA